MVDIEIGPTVIEGLIVLVHVTRECVGRTHTGGRGFVVQALRPGINCNQCDGTGTPLQLHIAGVVTGIPVPLAAKKAQRRRDIGEWPPGRLWAVSDRGVATRAWVAERRIRRR